MNKETPLEYDLPWHPTLDVDHKGNYPDGSPPTNPHDMWAFFDGPYYAEVNLGTFIRFALAKGSSKFRFLSDGANRITFYISGPNQLGCVWWNGNIATLSVSDKKLLLVAVKEMNAIATPTFRERTKTALEKLFNVRST